MKTLFIALLLGVNYNVWATLHGCDLLLDFLMFLFRGNLFFSLIFLSCNLLI